MACRKVEVSLRGVVDDEAIPAENKDCFAALLRNKMSNPHYTPGFQLSLE